MDFETVRIERRGTTGWLWLARPGQRNAQSKKLLDEFSAALDALTDDDGVKVIVLAGEGDHFSAGHDLKEAQAERADFTVEERYAYEELCYFRYSLKLYDCPKPTIAAVQGACVAAGFMLANLCDLVVASDDAFFADPVGRTLGAGAVEMLVHPWVLGSRRAREILFTGDRFTAAEALEWGMVNRVVARADLETAVDALAARIGESQSFTLKLIKQSLNRTQNLQGFRASLEAHFDTHQLSHLSEAFAEAKRVGLSAAIVKGKAS